jgi:2-polyprenyl-6-methoxyphenol hydroxylase-like FAD-dependent oxidoreductase
MSCREGDNRAKRHSDSPTHPLPHGKAAQHRCGARFTLTALPKQRSLSDRQAGGSLGGLLHGIALSRLGHRVTILERSPTPLLQDQGAGVVAGSDVQAFFAAYDRTRTPLAVPSRARQYLDRVGKVIDREEREQQMTSWDTLYNLLRTNFDGTKTDVAAPPPREPGDGAVEYAYGRKVTGFKDLGPGSGVSVTSVPTADDRGGERTETADLLIASDGASSTIRATLLPEVKRTYAGYVAWRGTCPEDVLSPETKDTLLETFTFFHGPGTQMLSYLIPGHAGTLERGHRLMNWVLYWNYPEGSAEHREIMTDGDGKQHGITLPPGGVREEVWAAHRRRAQETLPPQFSEIVLHTEVPFVQAITDVISSQAVFHGGRVLLVGDALAGFRPHTAASTSQAAFDAMQVAELVQGKITLEEWEKRVLDYARETQSKGVQMGDRSQFGEHPMGSQ